MRTILTSLFALVLVATGCSTNTDSATNASAASGSKIRVVAAENVWGSIAQQIGGDKVEVVSIVNSPDADPHDYELTPRDGATIAQAQLVILNGAGFDPWMTQALDANPNRDRKVIDISKSVGTTIDPTKATTTTAADDGHGHSHGEGENPHFWYSPNDVLTAVGVMADQLKAIDPSQSAYFDAQELNYTNVLKQQYRPLQEEIQQRFANAPIGATESVFEPMAQELKLNLVTPEAFMNAVSEGDEPTPADLATVRQQIQTKAIRVLVFNEQNATPDVQALVSAARAQNIPVVAVSETLNPPTAAFQDWQSAQLRSLRDALAQS